MAKLTWEWGDDHEIIIHKKKGKLTVDEIMRFLHEPEQMNLFEGMLAVIAFRVNRERDLYPYSYLMIGELEGDSQTVYMVEDDSMCPICGKNTLFPQYCPACGEPVKVKKEG